MEPMASETESAIQHDVGLKIVFVPLHDILLG